MAVVIVAFRARQSVIRALDALDLARRASGTAVELATVVVDNASGDDTPQRIREHAPWATVVGLPANVGFAAACNVGIGGTGDAEVIVLLNPDVDVRPDFVTRLAALTWPEDVAARGPAIFDEQGKLEQSARGFPHLRTGLLGRASLLARLRPDSPLLRRDLLADAAGGARPVDWVSGACLIAPARRFESIGSLDERYFMYWEDADWCRRAHLMGYEVIYDPALVVTHRQGSSSRLRPLATVIFFHRSALRYWRKHVARSPVSTVAAALVLGLRCALKLLFAAARTALAGGAAHSRP